MFSGALSNFQSLLAQPALLAMGSGLLAGAIAGTTLVVTGILPDRPDPQLMLLECPDAGREVAQVKTGVAMLVTGRNADGSWVELYVGIPGVERGWARAGNLKLDTPIDSLPVIPCVVVPVSTLGPPAASPTPSATPTEGPTAVATVVPSESLIPSAAPTPTPRVTPTAKPTATPLPPPPTIPPTPSPAATADVTPPSISNFVITSPTAFNGSYYIGDPPCNSPSATIHVTVTDPSSFSFVRLYYRPFGASTSFVGMSYIGNNVWSYTLTPPQSWPSGEVGLWVQAQDSFGNITSQVPFGNPNSTADPSLIWNPICIT